MPKLQTNPPIHQRKATFTRLAPDRLRLDGDTQARAGRDAATVAEYSERWKAGESFPPVKAVWDGSDYWAYDGEHRIVSALGADVEVIDVDFIDGTQREAVFLGLAANQAHGLRRTNADKRNAVERMLADKEWSAWSNRAIAAHVGVSEGLVRLAREEKDEQVRKLRTSDTEESQASEPETRIGKDGKSYPVPAAKPAPEPVQRWTPTPPEDEHLDGDQRRIKRLVSPKFFAFLMGPESGIAALDWQDIAAKTDGEILGIEGLMSSGMDLASALEQVARKRGKAAPPSITPAPLPAKDLPQKTPPASTAPTAQDKAVESARQRIGAVCGTEFEMALLDGRIKLDGAEIIRYAVELEDGDLKEAAPAIQAGWSVDRYNRVHRGQIDRSSKVDDLINKCVVGNGRVEVEVGQFLVTVEKR